MTSEEFFAGLRDAMRDADKTRDMLDRLMAASEVRNQTYDGAHGKGGTSDPTTRIASAIDLESRLRKRIDALEPDIERGLAILYGADGDGGLAKAKGPRYADAVCMAYLQDDGYDEIADVMQCSVRWVHELCSKAFRDIDAIGAQALIEWGK